MNFVADPLPSLDTFEVSLFGTGIGEGIAIHLGGGDWALVDTCRAGDNNLPMNLDYLQLIGVDVSTSVKIIVATHWHDDHVDGLSEAVKRCSNAKIAFSSALACDEFLSLVSLYANPDYILDREKSGVKEMGKVLRIIASRKESAQNYQPPIRTQADHLLHKNTHSELWAISPSSEAMQLAVEEMSKMWNGIERRSVGGEHHSSRDSIASPKRNLNAVALWVRYHDGRRVLLGSDLEEHGDQHCGWQAALTCQRFPDDKASIFKIPHHGSPNGDHEEVWNKIVEPDDPIAILTAYARGITPRPSSEDLARIKMQTDQLYYTTLPNKTKEKYVSPVEKTIASVVKDRRPLKKSPGHIQIRWDNNQKPQIRYAGSAGKFG